MIILRKEKLTFSHPNPITNSKISEVEKEYGWKYPKELKDDLKVGNGGKPNLRVFRPTKKVFGQSELEVNTMLSLNKNDLENVHTATKAISSENKDYKMLIPFMNTSGGNCYCIGPDDTVFYWDHETDKIERIAFSYKNFKDRLEMSEADKILNSEDYKYLESIETKFNNQLKDGLAIKCLELNLESPLYYSKDKILVLSIGNSGYKVEIYFNPKTNKFEDQDSNKYYTENKLYDLSKKVMLEGINYMAESSSTSTKMIEKYKNIVNTYFK